MSNTENLSIDVSLVQKLVATQFPQWADLSIKPVQLGGWDNRTFHLGEKMLVRLPSSKDYSLQVEKERKWLPQLAPHLPLPIPSPLAMGKPGQGYPWHWSIYNWLNGNTAVNEPINDLCQFATSLAEFLVALHQCDATGGPIAGSHSFYRGGDLAAYDAQTQQAIAALEDQIDVNAVTAIWNTALASTWQNAPIWVHGDVAAGNLLVENGKLSAVIDFGQLCVGDPACDLAIAWTFFKQESRKAFRATLGLDNATWARGRGWALWKALIICAAISGTNPHETDKSWQTINEILTDETI